MLGCTSTYRIIFLIVYGTHLIDMFKGFWGIISTDFSVYADMTKSEVMWNSFRNKLFAAWFQQQGVRVIPNVSWSRSWSYDFVLMGFRNTL